MDGDDWLATQFDEHRARLRAVAYRMLGSTSEAEDAVQETWFKLSRLDSESVQNLGGWLTTALARVCLDMLRTRRSRCEDALESAPEALGVDGDRNPRLSGDRRAFSIFWHSVYLFR